MFLSLIPRVPKHYQNTKKVVYNLVLKYFGIKFHSRTEKSLGPFEPKILRNWFYRSVLKYLVLNFTVEPKNR